MKEVQMHSLLGDCCMKAPETEIGLQEIWKSKKVQMDAKSFGWTYFHRLIPGTPLLSIQSPQDG
jgi:hypothetical protein